MMDWTAPFRKPSTDPRNQDETLGDRALDTLGELLRAYGEGAFDVETRSAEELRARCEGWVRHLVVGAPHPDGVVAAERCGRDFRGVAHFLGSHRRFERQLVDHLRELVGRTAERVAAMCNEDQEDDRLIASSLQGLRQAAQKGSISELRARVEETVEIAEAVFDRRRERHAAEIASLGERLSSLRNELDDVRRQASIDPLTQVYNRASLDRHLAAVVRLTSFTNEPVTLLMVDIDHFKRINDRYGHPSGDEALRRVADKLVRVASRRSDFVARYGGEEFAVVLSDTPREGAERVAERIVATLRERPTPIGNERTSDIRVSIGVAQLAEGESIASWVGRADGALYQAKRQGRDRHVTATVAPDAAE